MNAKLCSLGQTTLSWNRLYLLPTSPTGQLIARVHLVIFILAQQMAWQLGFISLPLCAMAGTQTNISRVETSRDLCKDALPTKPTDGNHATRAVVVAQ